MAKTTRKAVISLLMTAIMIFTIITAIPARAADELAVTVGSATGSPGSTVTIDISLTQNPGIAGLGLTIIYDSSALIVQAVSSSLPGPAFIYNSNMQGRLVLAWQGRRILSK